MLLQSINVIAQSIPEGYKLLGEVSVNDYQEPRNLFVSRDGKIAAIEFGGRNSTIQILDTKSWEVLGEFKAKGWAYLYDSFVDKSDSKVLYITGRGNKLHRYNYETNEYDLISRRKVKDPVYTDPFTVGFASTSYHGQITMHMLPEQFIITCNHQTAKIYVWESLVADK
ncbi:hypothetical protein [Roseivirga sp. E12]|uniref:hypothetical protein n=1 Tax=Roseivirga sp. E12 TaxID=2819237 RepID=UPI001ABBEBCE|nr:hypothetical protein [Roseivirga sp. E12]MBO3697212.1 hypothetical protein [Roseivirga sp. E12]